MGQTSMNRSLNAGWCGAKVDRRQGHVQVNEGYRDLSLIRLFRCGINPCHIMRFV